jgi:hypothetical protein
MRTCAAALHKNNGDARQEGVVRFFLFLALSAAAALSTLASAPATASCPEHAFADPSRIKLAGDAVLIATHASSNDDGRIATKLGVDEAVRFAKSRRIAVVYLQDDRSEENYFMEDCKPDYWVRSEDGEIRFEVTPAHVYSIGGHLEECQSRTLNDVLLDWSRKPPRDLTVTYFMDAIFSNGKRIEESDPFYPDYQRFMGIVTYSRPGGEHYPKLTLLETMGVILKEQRQYEYLQRVLPRYDRTLPDYRVELRINDSLPRVLQPGRGRRPPVLRFEFLNSAADIVEGNWASSE